MSWWVWILIVFIWMILTREIIKFFVWRAKTNAIMDFVIKTRMDSESKYLEAHGRYVLMRSKFQELVVNFPEREVRQLTDFIGRFQSQIAAIKFYTDMAQNFWMRNQYPECVAYWVMMKESAIGLMVMMDEFDEVHKKIETDAKEFILKRIENAQIKINNITDSISNSTITEINKNLEEARIMLQSEWVDWKKIFALISGVSEKLDKK